MMWWLTYLIVAVSLQVSAGQNASISEDDIERLFNDAIADVLSQHADVPSKSRPFPPPPVFKMPDNFMRSFVPGTGVGNREELLVDRIDPLPVFEDALFSRFLFKHFNNTDYVAGIADNSMVLMRINTSAGEYFMLSKDDVVVNSTVKSGKIKDVVLFTRIAENVEVLSAAVAMETVKETVVYIYEIIGDVGYMVAMIDLNINPSKTVDLVKKIAYVQSSRGGSLVVLTDTTGEAKFSYNQRGHSKLNHYIEVSYPSAVDLITLTVHGHGYIAVANSYYCEVYKMDDYVGSHIRFDTLGPFSAIVDLEYFRLGFHHFLAVADFETQKLFTWKKGEFSSKQILTIPNMAQVYATSVESCRDEVLLLAIKWDGSVEILVFSGENENFVKVDVAVPAGYSVQPGSLTSLPNQESVTILFTDLYGKHGALVIRTSLKTLKDPLLAQGKNISEVMKTLQEKIDSQRQEVKRMKNLLTSAVRNDGTQTITGRQKFDDITSTEGAVVELVNEFVVEWEESMLTLEEYRRGADDLEKTVESLESLVENIERKLLDAVLLDEDAVVTGQKIFKGGVSAEDLGTASLNLHKVAGIDLPQLQKDIYRLDNPELIDGTLTFKEHLTVTVNLDVDSTVNGIDISEDVMTTNTEQISNALMIFTNTLKIQGDLDVFGKINGIDFSKEVVMLDGSQHITAPKNFLNGIQADNVHTKLLDGIHIDDLYRKAFTISGNQTLTDAVSFSKITTGDITLLGRLNGYDLKELEASIVRTDRPSTVTGYKIFKDDVIVEGDLVVHGTVNGLKIPDDLVLTDVPQTITGTKEFLGHVTANDVTVSGLVDNLKIPDDIITLSKDEEISSTLYFADGIIAEKDIIVEGLVDGVDISEIARQAMKLNDSTTFEHAVFSGPVTITGNIDVNGLVNKINLNDLLSDIVFRDEMPIVIHAKKNFQKLIVDEVKVESFINGYNITTDFMRVSEEQDITGIKTFRRATFNSVYIGDGKISDVDINELFKEKVALEWEGETITDRKIEFVDEVIVKDLTVIGTVNGLRIPEDVVLNNSEQPISNKHFSGRVVVDNLIVDGDVSVDIFGGLNFTEFYNDRITLSTNQNIPGDVRLGNTAASKMTIFGGVNGRDINDFAKNVMSKSKDNQVVTGAKEFSGKVTVFGDVRTAEGINGYNLSDINRRAFKLLEDNVVTATLEFEDNVTMTDLVAGEINGVNITLLNEDSLKKKGLQYVKGNVVFKNGFDVVGDIIATEVNGLVFVDDVLLKTIPQTIKGQFTFEKMVIDGDMEVKGLINGLNLSEIVPKLARIDQEETIIESSITFKGPVRVHESINVSGTVNEVDFKALFDNVLRKTGDQKVYGHKTFKGHVTIEGDIDVKNVNGIDWKDFVEDVVWIDRPQAIHSSKTFADDVTAENMLVSGVAHVGLINGKDLEKFMAEAVFIDEPAHITGPIVFKNPVEITSDLRVDLINGFDLKKDVITTMCSDEGPQLITGQKTFQKLKVFSDIYTDEVNSHDLQALYEDTLLTEGNQTIFGHKTIFGDVIFKKNVYPDTVNGMVLSRDLVTLDTPQEIEGPLTFQGDVYVEKDVVIDGLLNGVDFRNLSREALYLKTEQVVEGTYTFENAVVLSNVEVGGTVNGINLPVFDKNVTNFLIETEGSVDIMHRYAEDQCLIAKYVQESLESSYYALDSFILHQDLEFSASFVNGEPEALNLVYVDEFANTTTSVRSIWDRRTKLFSATNFSVATSARVFPYRFGSIILTINIGINSKDSSIVVIASGHPSELQNGFDDAAALLRKSDVVIALMFADKGKCDIYLLKEHPVKAYSYDLDSSLSIGEDSSSIVMFEQSGVLYIATSSSPSLFEKGFSQIFAHKNGKWQLVQQIQSSGSFVKHFEHQNHHYLAFANSAPVYQTKEPKSIQIYRNSGLRESFDLFQKVPFDDAKGMELFHFGDLSQLHLITWNETTIQVFGLEGESGMQEYFTIYGKCVRDVKPLLIEDELYLAVGQQNLVTSDPVTSLLYKGLIKGVKYKPYNLDYC